MLSYRLCGILHFTVFQVFIFFMFRYCGWHLVKDFGRKLPFLYVCTQNAYNIPHQDPACAFAQTAHVDILYLLLRKVKIVTFYNLTLNRIHIYILYIIIIMALASQTLICYGL